MEDRTVIGLENQFVAVFDGHGGFAVAQHLFETFLPKLNKKLTQHGSVDLHSETVRKYITESFHEIDQECLQKKICPENGGSCAALSFIHQNNTSKPVIIAANIGDCRVVLSQNKKAIDLTEDHKPDLPREKARIEKLGTKMQNTVLMVKLHQMIMLYRFFCLF